MGYADAAAAIDWLSRGLGFELVRRWPQEHRDTVQDRASFVAWLSSGTGRDLAPFFDEWLGSPTPPV